MAGLEDLAAYLLGDATQKTIAAENPYYNLKQAPDAVTSALISNVSRNPAGTSTKEALAWGLGSGLLSGLLGGQGDEYQKTLTDRYSNAVMGKAGTAEDAQLPPGLFSSASRAKELWKVQSGLERRQIDDKVNADMRKELFGAMAKATTDPERAQVMKSAKMFGIQLPGGMEEVKPIAEASGAATPSAGPKTVKQQIIDTANELRANDPKLTPNQAMETATQMNKGVLGGLNKLDETIKGLYGAADTMRSIADQSEAAVSEAGQTGGIFAPGGAGDKASYLYSAISPTEAAQRAAAGKIKSIGPDILRQNYVKGSGALSENEMKAYLGSGPSVENSPTTNQALIDKYRQVADWQEEKAQFIEYWRDTFGSSSGLDKAWSEYKKENPLFVQESKSKTPVANNERPSAVEWHQMRIGRAPAQEAPQDNAAQIDVQSFIADAKRRGLSKEQARAEWSAMKGK